MQLAACEASLHPFWPGPVAVMGTEESQEVMYVFCNASVYEPYRYFVACYKQLEAVLSDGTRIWKAQTVCEDRFSDLLTRLRTTYTFIDASVWRLTSWYGSNVQTPVNS